MLISTYSWLDPFPKFFKAHHLGVIAEDMLESPDHYIPITAQTTFLGQLEFYAKNPEIKGLLEPLQEEFNSGAIVDVTWMCVVGRKAL